MLFDFPVEIIEIRTGDESWGPFSWSLAGAIPPNDSVEAVTVKSLAPDGVTDSTSALIKADSVVVSDGSVTLQLNYPGDALTGRHILTFEVTFASGETTALKYAYILVEK
jgi:hypothetical protein